MRKLIFRFDIHPLTLHLGNDQDEAWGLSVLQVKHFKESRALLQFLKAKNYWVIGIFFLRIPIIIQIANEQNNI